MNQGVYIAEPIVLELDLGLFLFFLTEILRCMTTDQDNDQ